MDQGQEVNFEELIALTGHPGWAELQTFIRSEIYSLQADALETPTWEEVKEKAGAAKAMMFIHNLRDMIVYEDEAAAGEYEGDA